MKTLALLGVAVTVGLLALTPSAVAFHGAPYHAHGIATKGNAVYLADVTWTGWAIQSFVVDLKDPLGNVLSHEAMPGYEILLGGGPRTCQWEIFLYTGVDTATNGNVFKVTGIQQEIGPTNCVVLAQHMVYEGTYRGYTLALLVDSPN
ncbi:MAG: hypothetical protein LC624_10675, partial [Halobacteriales archaeon]|nr:hypothetical protein [Halobacteriales archaeon]